MNDGSKHSTPVASKRPDGTPCDGLGGSRIHELIAISIAGDCVSTPAALNEVSRPNQEQGRLVERGDVWPIGLIERHVGRPLDSSIAIQASQSRIW
jgi:hypothetical protein